MPAQGSGLPQNGHIMGVLKISEWDAGVDEMLCIHQRDVARISCECMSYARERLSAFAFSQ